MSNKKLECVGGHSVASRRRRLACRGLSCALGIGIERLRTCRWPLWFVEAGNVGKRGEGEVGWEGRGMRERAGGGRRGVRWGERVGVGVEGSEGGGGGAGRGEWGWGRGGGGGRR